MMTTYILAGGNDRVTEGYGNRLSTEVTKYVANPKILSCFFSWPVESWEAKSQDWKAWFWRYFGENLGYDYAKKDTFFE